MPASIPPLRVLVAGGGVAAVEAVLALRALAGRRVSSSCSRPPTTTSSASRRCCSPFSGAAAPRVTLDGPPDARRRPPPRGARGGRRRAARGAHHRRRRLGYDRLVVATGAHAIDGVPGATTFRGPISAGRSKAPIRRAEHALVFVAPADAGWLLPLYELALLDRPRVPRRPRCRRRHARAAAAGHLRPDRVRRAGPAARPRRRRVHRPHTSDRVRRGTRWSPARAR